MPLWYTTKQFAVAAQISTAAVRRNVKSGKLPGLKTATGWRIPDPGPEMWARLKHPFRDLDRQMMLRPAEVRAILGIKRRALAYARATGTLPGAKIDGVWQCSLSEMLLYLEKRNAKRRGLKRRQSGGGGWCHNHSRIELIKWGKKRVEEFLNQVNADDPELPLPPLEDFERYIQRMSQAPEPLRSTQLRCLLEMSEEWSRILRILLQPTSVTPKQL